MRYRVVMIKRNHLEPHFEVQYRKWFMWHTVMNWHDRLPFKVPVQWHQQEDAERYIEMQNETRTVVIERDVYKTFHEYGGDLHWEKVKKNETKI